MIQHFATLLLTLSLVHNSKQHCLSCVSDKPEPDPIQECETHSHFLSSKERYNDRLPVVKKDNMKVIYGNAGYYRSYGAEVYTSCKIKWVPDELTMATIHVEDSRGYVSDPVKFKPCGSNIEQIQECTEKKYFPIPNPNPLADYYCVCKVAATDNPEKVKSCLKCNSSKKPLPEIKTCSADTCYNNKDKPMCYENVQSGDVYHDWPKQLFKTCPYAPAKFNNKCSPFERSSTVPDGAMSFYIDGQLVHSGSVYYVVGDETLVVTSSCNKQAAELKCQVWMWKNTTAIGDRQRGDTIEIEPYHAADEQCSIVAFDISATVSTSNHDKNWLVNLVGCHTKSDLKKQVEFYVNFVEVIQSIGSNQSLQCLVPLQTKDVIEPAVTLSPDTCACNLTLVACNPLVTVKRVQHKFRCDNGKLWTGKTTKRAKTTRKLWLPTQSSTASAKASVPYWVWIMLAGILILLTVVMMVVLLYTYRRLAHRDREPSSKTAKLSLSDTPKTSQPKKPKVILDYSMFQNKIVDEKSSSTKSPSPINKLVFMGDAKAEGTESEYFLSS